MQAVALRMTHHKLLKAFSSYNSVYNAMKVFTGGETNMVFLLADILFLNERTTEHIL